MNHKKNLGIILEFFTVQAQRLPPCMGSFSAWENGSCDRQGIWDITDITIEWPFSMGNYGELWPPKLLFGHIWPSEKFRARHPSHWRNPPSWSHPAPCQDLPRPALISGPPRFIYIYTNVYKICINICIWIFIYTYNYILIISLYIRVCVLSMHELDSTRSN